MKFEQPPNKIHHEGLTSEEADLLKRVQEKVPEPDKEISEKFTTGPEQVPKHRVLTADDQKKWRDETISPHGPKELK